MDGARLDISNLFYLLRQADPPGPAYNQPDDLRSPVRAPKRTSVHVWCQNSERRCNEDAGVGACGQIERVFPSFFD